MTREEEPAEDRLNARERIETARRNRRRKREREKKKGRQNRPRFCESQLRSSLAHAKGNHICTRRRAAYPPISPLRAYASCSFPHSRSPGLPTPPAPGDRRSGSAGPRVQRSRDIYRVRRDEDREASRRGKERERERERDIRRARSSIR